jgi:predicted RNase H-like HicB family nuclease
MNEKLESGYISIGVVVTREGNQYSSWCPELDIASCGDNPEEAIENLNDALELYITTLKEEGELESVLKERGIKVVQADDIVIPNSFLTQYRIKLPAAA